MSNVKVVLDANVFVSAFINTHGTPKQIIDFWQAERFELLTSAPILTEIERVLRHPKIAKLHKLSQQELKEFLALLLEETHVVSPTQRLQVSADEADNRYLECAQAGSADYLVTGDKKHLLPLGEYGGFRIVSPAVFITILNLEQ